MTSLSSRLERTSPRSLSARGWWATWFRERPAIQERSHTQDSSPARKAVVSMSRVWSERARARFAALRALSSTISDSRIDSALSASNQMRSQCSSAMLTLQYLSIC
jgi:hypothetical protein